MGTWDTSIGRFVLSRSDGGYELLETRTGWRSIDWAEADGTLLFHWSHDDDVLALRPNGDGTLTIACYGAAAKERFDRSGVSVTAPSWTVRAARPN